jgi:response regulator RpfG family c-di-GMP phosphodiesterase
MRRHILIVDDEELFREICREMLEERGYRVSVAPDAPTALTVLKAEPVDLLVADITLPGMDGLTLIEQVHESHPGIPAIVITGFLNQENMLRSLNLGVRGFLTKPFFYDELFVSVEKALEHSQATRNELLLRHYLPMIHLGEEILSADHDELFSTTLGTVLKIAMQQTGATQGFILTASGRHAPELAASVGFGPEEQPRLAGYAGLAQRALAGGTDEVVSPDLVPGMTSLALRMPGHLQETAALVLARPKGDNSFTDEERNLARLLAIQAAIAIHHHQSHSRTLAGSAQAARALTEISGILLPPDAGHPAGKRLAELADLGARMDKALGGTPEQQRAVRQAIAFHNLGKAFLPPDLLRKAGPLSEAEWVTMRTYPAVGADRLLQVEDLRGAAPLVGAQRERWDGAGYPNGWAGEAIPLGARIVGVVSAWGAMRCERPYRHALGPEAALDEIRAGAGTVFCPEVSEAFLKAAAQAAHASQAS